MQLHLVQLSHISGLRKLALVQEPHLILLHSFPSVIALAEKAASMGGKLNELVISHLSEEKLIYDEVYTGINESWSILPAADVPDHPDKCILSGTGLTHKASAENRQKMHDSTIESTPTDSMIIYQWGLKDGKASLDHIGVQPEWFYKGNGALLRAHREKLEVPDFALDGGEEAELAGVYFIAQDGTPWRIGFTTANEFSDHVMEKQNYLYLAPSKLRQCAIGPELVLAQSLDSIHGKVSILRNENPIWEQNIHSGEQHMAHNLLNLEHHHFKYPNHRIPGQLHIHFLGADAFSYGENIRLESGDQMHIHWKGMGRALQNPLHIASGATTLSQVKVMS